VSTIAGRGTRDEVRRQCCERYHGIKTTGSLFHLELYCTFCGLHQCLPLRQKLSKVPVPPQKEEVETLQNPKIGTSLGDPWSE
jgi:hypothetical protein